ncbi:MAG: hypothetical protein J0I93_12585 [Legionella sp.]|nr:hypothetical protein [Legionella sp.]
MSKKLDTPLPTMSSPTDTDMEIYERILNSRIGIIDTPEELDQQIRNLGPKDTAIEQDTNLNDGPEQEEPTRPKR